MIAIRDGAPHLAMIATRKRTRWGLPKGAAHKGESAEEAAVREVLEETGLEADVIAPLETIEYFFRAGDSLIHKFVDFFIMAWRGGTIRPQLEEVDDAIWVPLAAAAEQSSFASEKKMIEKLIAIWDAMDDAARGRFGSH